ncbi:MAG TPA: cupin domain-containing protein [Gaiellaceae bacterium]
MIVNLRDCDVSLYDEAPSGRRFAMRRLGEGTAADRTGMTVYELEPGNAAWPYHFELADEEWMFVIDGEVVLRTPDGERTMRAGDVACFPIGAAGAHEVRNDSGAVSRFALTSVRLGPGGGAVYPDSGKVLVYAPGFRHRGLLGEEVEYW